VIMKLFNSPTPAGPNPAAAPPPERVKANGSAANEAVSQLAPVPSERRPDTPARVIPLGASGTLPLLELTRIQPHAAEQYRIIRTAVVAALQRPFVIAVSSPGVADGKTLTSVNLATALAMTGEGRTLLIDADLRGASIHERVHIEQSPGLGEVLSGKCRLQDAIVRFDGLLALHVLPGGEATVNPTDLLDSPAWASLIAEARSRFQHVVLDGPPVALFADYDLIAAVRDGVLAVVRPDHTNRLLYKTAMTKMRPKLTGVVLNGTDDWFLWKKSTHRYYSHYKYNKYIT
jgi:capsular exopolysaccharide synthesis family protein